MALLLINWRLMLWLRIVSRSMMELYAAICFVGSVYNCVGVTMESYHDVLASAIVSVELSRRLIPDLYFTGFDTREWQL